MRRKKSRKFFFHCYYCFTKTELKEDAHIDNFLWPGHNYEGKEYNTLDPNYDDCPLFENVKGNWEMNLEVRVYRVQKT